MRYTTLILISFFASFATQAWSKDNRAAQTEERPVKWIDLKGLVYQDHQLKKINASTGGWGKLGARSEGVLEAGKDGHLVFSALQGQGNQFLGLTSDDPDAHYKSIDYAFYMSTYRSYCYVFENGRYKRSIGKYQQGDTFKIKREGSTVKYLHNDRVVYTSTVASNKSLFVDASLSQSAQHLEKVKTSFFVDDTHEEAPVSWAELKGIGYDDSKQKLLKLNSSPYGWGSMGARSEGALESSDDGYLVFTVEQSQSNQFVGFSSGSFDAHYRSIDYALYMSTYHKRFYVFEKGSYKRNLGSYKQGDTFKIVREEGKVKYLHNDRVVYTSTLASKKALYVDLSFPNLFSSWSVSSIRSSFAVSSPVIAKDCSADAKVNSVTTRFYDQQGKPIAAGKSFVNALGKPLQTQAINFTKGQILASQPIYDKHGRPVIQTLTAPTGENHFCYKDDFVQNSSGEIYHDKDFDQENYSRRSNYISSGEVDRPEQVGKQKGTLGWYYSDNNSMEPHVATTGYPYTRVEYDANNPGRKKRVAAVGDQHRMGTGHETESYTMLETGELMYVYGPLQSWILDSNLPGYQIRKSISIDPDGKQTVGFTDIDGKLIATCLAGKVDGKNKHHLAVESSIGELGYVDIHLPEGCERSLDLTFGSYQILDLRTNRYRTFSGQKTFRGTKPNLPAGFYRIEASGSGAGEEFTLKYDLNYHEFALNYYDKAGRLVKTVPPLGVNQGLMSNGIEIEQTNVKKYSNTLYYHTGSHSELVYFDGNSFIRNYNLPTSDDQLVLYTDLSLGFRKKNRDAGLLGGASVRKAAPQTQKVIKRAGRFFDKKHLPALNIRSKQVLEANIEPSQAQKISSKSMPAMRMHVPNYPTPPKPPEDWPKPFRTKSCTYKLMFAVYSDASDLANPDFIEEGEITLWRWMNGPDKPDILVSNTDYSVGANSALGKQTDKVTVELIGIYKEVHTSWLVGSPSTSREFLTDDDLDFLAQYEMGFTAAYYQSKGIQHRMEDTYEYNSLNWLLSSTTSDAGKTQYVYAEDGSLRFSQNAQQKKDKAFSYTHYDRVGRAVEVGLYSGTKTTGFPVSVQKLASQEDGLEDRDCSERTHYMYDKADAHFHTETGLSSSTYRQHFLAGKLSKSSTKEPKTNTSWYSYDEQGRATWMVQKTEGLGVKTVHYLYDAKGNVAQVIYQKENASEAFYHKYEYDADNRLSQVHTSSNGSSWDREAAYEYYLHGPLKRVELADKLQGIDYLYTVQGQLKSINSPNLGARAANLFKDPGGDGTNGFARDVFGMTVDYFSGDYRRKDTQVSSKGVNNIKSISALASSGAYLNGNFHSLGSSSGAVAKPSYYNGNIVAVRWNTQGQSLATRGKQHMYDYRYDHRNWLKEANFGTFTPNVTAIQIWTPGVYTLGSTSSQNVPFIPHAKGDYQVSNIAYDANGNLLSLNRNGYTKAGQTNVMDRMNYRYKANNKGQRTDNKLRSINDVSHRNVYADVSNQSADNYRYNAIGQLQHNAQEGHYYTYDAYGLVTGVYKDAYYTQPVAKYDYDDRGFRIKKQVFSGGTLAAATTYYVRDASGHVLSVYEKEGAGSVKQKELPIYGARRIGQYQASNKKKSYELTDHLGTVRALISRDKTSNGSAELLMRADYYPFGMEMPGRKYSSEAYRYDYQGQYAEKDGETGLHHFELRQWDARIARWNSTDPYGQYFSPYMGMGNNPVSLVDPDGGYSKIGAWIRNGFRSKGMDRVNGEWGFYEVGMSGSSSFNANGNFTTMDMNIQFNGSDGLSQAFNNSTNWDKVASGAYTTIGGTLSTVGGVVAIATGVAAPAGFGGVCLGVPAMGFGVARMIDGFQGGNRIIPGGLAEGVDIGVGGVGGDGSVGQVVDIFSGGLPKNVISGTLMGYGIYNSNIGQIIFRSPNYNSQNMPDPFVIRRDNTNVVLPTIKY